MQTGQQPNQPADKREVVELSSRPSNKPRCGTTPAMTPRRWSSRSRNSRSASTRRRPYS